MKIKMKFFLMQSLFLLIFGVLIFSCETDNQRYNNQQETAMTEMDSDADNSEDMARNDNEMPDAMKPSDEQNTLMEQDKIDRKVYYYPDAYTYEQWDIENKKPMTVKASKKSSEKASSAKVYTDIDKLDRPPLFSKECMEKKKPEKCSNEAIQDYIRANADYPNRALTRNEEGVEYVTFVINKNGVVESDIQIESQGEACTDCASEAKRLVKEMPTWIPATKDGKSVNVRVILPVKFDKLTL
ncbi:MAG: hypothetical protein DHS20C18_43900 [Saprospiraceae bacterium]|nr:MAG: hypothetical protein DHS20C18_43900 [Saprospiraceae bacterium]